MSKRFIPGKEPPQTSIQFVWPSLRPKQYLPAVSDRVKAEENRILKEAKDKAQFVEQEAYEKGFAQGEKDGQELGRKRVDAVVGQIASLIEGLEGQRESLYRLCEKEMLQLVLTIARKVVHREVQLREEVVLDTLRETSRHIIDQRRMTIRLNPLDYQFLKDHPCEALPSHSGQRAEMVPDPSMTRGGCLVETPFGDVDGRIESQLNEIASLLWERFEKSDRT